MFTNRFFNLVIVMALVLVASLTVREVLATSTVLSDTEEAQAADAARWTAMGEYYADLETIQSREQAADAAHWIAMGMYYENQAKSQSLGLNHIADAARWTAMAEYYLRLNSASK